MKYFILALSIFLATISMMAQEYDQALAQELGADELGMKSYVLVILKTGPAVVSNKEQRDSIFAGHMKNIGRLSEDGWLVSAGPIGKNDKHYRGIYIFDVRTVDEAEKLVVTDPAVASGILAAEYFSWYASAALPVHKKYHKKIQKRGL
jgi:uncharacterized protein YciI